MKGAKDQKMDLLNKKFFLPLLFFLYISLLFLTLTDYDEGAFAATSLQMLRESQFFIPYLGDSLRLEKPILTYWIQVISISLFGASEFALRLPSLIAAFLWAYIFGKFIKDKMPDKSQSNYIFTLLTLPGVLVMSVVATADAFLNLFICLVMINIYNYSDTKKEKFLLGAALYLGLGFLTKGFAILAIIGPASLLYFLIIKKLDRFFSAIFNAKAWIIFGLIVVPWFLVLFLREGASSIEYLLLGQSFGRFSDTMESHSGSVFYYLLLLPFLVFPYFVNFLKGLRRSFAEKKPIDLFCLIWFSWVLVFFSFSSTKLPHYLVYGLTPVVYFIEKNTALLSNRHYSLNNFLAHSLMLLFYLGLPFLFEYVYNLDPSMEASPMFIKEFSGNLLFIGSCILGVLVIFILLRAKYKYVKGLQFMALFQVFLLTIFVIPSAVKVMQADLKSLGIYAKTNNISFAVNKINKPTLSFYSSTNYLRDFEDSEYFITRIDKVDIQRYEVIQKRGNYVLLRQKYDEN